MYWLQKNRIFLDTYFELKLNISGTLAYNFFLVSYNEIKSWVGLKSRTQFLRKKQLILPNFESFVRYRINFGIGRIMRPIQIYLAVSKVYIFEKMFCRRLMIDKIACSNFEIANYSNFIE